MNGTPTRAPEGVRRGRHTIRGAMLRRIAAATVGAVLLSGLAPAAEASDLLGPLQVNFTEGRRFSKLWVSATGTVRHPTGHESVTLRIGKDVLVEREEDTFFPIPTKYIRKRFTLTFTYHWSGNSQTIKVVHEPVSTDLFDPTRPGDAIDLAAYRYRSQYAGTCGDKTPQTVLFSGKVPAGAKEIVAKVPKRERPRLVGGVGYTETKLARVRAQVRKAADRAFAIRAIDLVVGLVDVECHPQVTLFLSTPLQWAVGRLAAGTPVLEPPPGVVDSSMVNPEDAEKAALVADSIWAQIAHIHARTGIDMVISLYSSGSPNGIDPIPLSVTDPPAPAHAGTSTTTPPPGWSPTG